MMIGLPRREKSSVPPFSYGRACADRPCYFLRPSFSMSALYR